MNSRNALSIPAHFPEGLREPAECDADGEAAVAVGGRPAVPAPSGTAGSRTPPTRSPRRRTTRAIARRRSAKPNVAGVKNPGEIDQQQHAAADVAHRVAGRRDAIGLVRLRDVRQERVVENRASPTRRCCR